MESESPRRPHHRFQLYVLSEALLDGPRFAAKYSASDGAAQLAELWNATNAEFPDAERVASEGLALEAHGGPASPVVFVMLPRPAKRTEAYSIALIPTARLEGQNVVSAGPRALG